MNSKSMFLVTSLAVSLLASFDTKSEIIGNYKQINSSEFDSHFRYYDYNFFDSSSILGQDFPHLNGTPTTVCTDTHSRRVPGVVIKDKCVVEWSGRISANQDFYILLDSDTTWERLYPSRKLSGMEITNGGWDKNEYVYHCLIETKSKFGKEIYIKTLGKYIPNKNACYTSQNYRFKKVKLDNNNYRLSVLVKQN